MSQKPRSRVYFRDVAMLAVGLVGGTILYHAVVHGGNWEIAFERSVAYVMALLTAWWAWKAPRETGGKERAR